MLSSLCNALQKVIIEDNFTARAFPSTKSNENAKPLFKTKTKIVKIFAFFLFFTSNTGNKTRQRPRFTIT